MLTIGYQILVMRQEKGMTQAELAKKAGIPQPNLSNIEKGKQDLTVTTLRKIAYALETPVAGFFEDEAVHRGTALKLTRPVIERLSRAIAHRDIPLNKEEQQVAEWFQDIMPGKSRKEMRAKKMYRSWFELKKRFSASAIQTICERVREQT
jgi:transcriptional regulator with XRE-family HTH domain